VSTLWTNPPVDEASRVPNGFIRDRDSQAHLQECLDRIEAVLGRPSYRRENVAIYQGDCIHLLRELPRGLFDLTVTSPPYNIGKEYEKPRSLEEYVRWSTEWISEVHRTSAPEASFWLNLGYVPIEGKGKAVPLPYLLWGKTPFFLLQEIVWNYGAGVAARNSFSPRNEKFLWYVADPDRYIFNLDEIRDKDVKYPNQKKNGKLKCNPDGKNPTDVWQFPKVTSGNQRASPERTAHPAQFPIAIIERIIRACSNESGLVLDPFMGSGTTAEAAARLGRGVIGFELRSDYVEIASRRLDASFEEWEIRQSQSALFG
jgi:adenine-specific DNA-methyltransferase